MDPTLVPGTWFESQFQICVYEHAILRTYISFFYHYSHRITYFFDEHHRLLLITYLCQPKTEVTSHSEVDLVETITSVCSRSPKKLSRVA